MIGKSFFPWYSSANNNDLGKILENINVSLRAKGFLN